MATPYTVSVCLLIQDFVERREEVKGCYASEERKTKLLECYALSQFLLDEISDDSSFEEKTLAELKRTLLSSGLRESENDLEQRLVDITSPDCLYGVMSELEEILLDPEDAELDEDGEQLDPGSLFGVYLRRVCAAHKSLMFDGLSDLFDQIQQYTRSETLSDRAERRPPQVAELNIDRMQRYTQARAAELQRRLGAAPCEQVESEIARLLSLNPDLYQAHFLRYINYVTQKEFAKALDALHQYFDYFGARAASAPEDGGTATNPLQYAVLNLAILHIAFQHHEQATQALLEAIRMAQLAGDHTCLVHALALLADVCRAIGNTQQATQLFRQCVEAQDAAAARLAKIQKEIKARQGAGPTEAERALLRKARPSPKVEAQAFLKLAIFHLQQARVPRAPKGLIGGGGARAAVLYGSDTAAVATGPTTAALDMIGRSTALASRHHALDMIGVGLLMRSRAWDLAGHEPLATTYSRAFLRLYAGRCGTSDADSALAIANLASAEPHRGDRETLLSDTKAFPDRGFSRFAERRHLLLFREALRAGELQSARVHADALASLSPTNGEDATAHAEAHVARAQLLSATGRVVESRQLLLRVLRRAAAQHDCVLEARVLLLVVRQFLDGHDAVHALPHLLRLLGAELPLQFASIRAEAMVLVARTQLLLGQPRDARRVLEGCRAQVLGHCSPSERAELLLSLAEATLGDTSASQRELRAAVDTLQQARAVCEEERDRNRVIHCYYLTARVYQRLGNSRKRNEAASLFAKARAGEERRFRARV